jgi:hypothetical protein
VKAGDLVKIIWTDGVDGVPVVSGIVTEMPIPIENSSVDYERQRVEIFCNGKHSRFERGDLEVVSESR